MYLQNPHTKADRFFVSLVDYSKGYRDLVHVSARTLDALLADERVAKYDGMSRPVYEFKGAIDRVVATVGGVKS